MVTNRLQPAFFTPASVPYLIISDKEKIPLNAMGFDFQLLDYAAYVNVMGTSRTT
jgi:hypothetical protein